jgi:single-stranded-DNA-specific exonuclease
LRACDDCLIGHGGHAAAAGFKLIPSNLDKLRDKFNAHILSVFPDGPPPPRLMLDSEMPFSALTLGLMQTIDKLEPYGAENPKPRFLATGLQIEGTPRRMGTSEQHLSFKVKQGGTSIRAVAFGFGDRFDDLMSAGGACSLAFTPKVNEWQGRRTVELEVIDFQAGVQVELH